MKVVVALDNGGVGGGCVVVVVAVATALCLYISLYVLASLSILLCLSLHTPLYLSSYGIPSVHTTARSLSQLPVNNACRECYQQ